jgi:LAS superfamily LD-carboxypeptidase LdcB
MAAATAINQIRHPGELTGRLTTHVREQPELACTLHPAAAQALLQMRAAAAGDGIDLQVVSAFRDFERQLLIWNGKFRGERPVLGRRGEPLDVTRLTPGERIDAILLWSALPGASRHHWGTEVDLIDRACLAPGARPQLVHTEYAGDGCFAGLDAWLTRHAADFGFFRPYDRDRGGVQPEPWHLSYAPLADPALAALTPAVLATALQSAAIDGGQLILQRLPELHERYVRAVAPPSVRALAAARLTA